MADTIKSIKPSGGDYTSVTNWEAALPASIADGDQQIGEMYIFSGGLSDSTLISGTSTSGTGRIILRAAAGNKHDGTPGTGAYIVNDNAKTTLRWGGDNVSIIGIEVDGNGNNQDGIDPSPAGITGTHFIEDFIIHDTGTANGILFSDANVGHAANGVIYNCDDGMRAGSASTTFKAYNITAFGNTNFGLLRPLCVNCLSMSNGTDYLQTGTGSDYNVSSDATAPGANNLQSKTTYGDYFTDHANDDYSLKGTTANGGIFGATGLGGNSLSGIFTDDIIGTTRSAWDIGAFEFVAAGGVTVPVFVHHYRQMGGG